jgi:hypothetical protein
VHENSIKALQRRMALKSGAFGSRFKCHVFISPPGASGVCEFAHLNHKNAKGNLTILQQSIN